MIYIYIFCYYLYIRDTILYNVGTSYYSDSASLHVHIYALCSTHMIIIIIYNLLLSACVWRARTRNGILYTIMYILYCKHVKYNIIYVIIMLSYVRACMVQYTLFYRPNVGRRKSSPVSPVPHFLSPRNCILSLYFPRKSNCMIRTKIRIQ